MIAAGDAEGRYVSRNPDQLQLSAHVYGHAPTLAGLLGPNADRESGCNGGNPP
jgi:hypothetical protein